MKRYKIFVCSCLVLLSACSAESSNQYTATDVSNYPLTLNGQPAFLISFDEKHGCMLTMLNASLAKGYSVSADGGEQADADLICHQNQVYTLSAHSKTFLKVQTHKLTASQVEYRISARVVSENNRFLDMSDVSLIIEEEMYQRMLSQSLE